MGRVLKIFLGGCVVVTIFAIVILTLTLTVFKVHDPTVSIDLVGLKNLFKQSEGSNPNVSLIATVITMGNPNHASFKFKDTKGYVHFLDTIVGEVPIGAGIVPPRSTINVNTNTSFMITKLLADTRFVTDLLAKKPLLLTSTAEVPGKAIALKFIKMKAMVHSSCNISVNITSRSAHSTCVAKIKVL